MLFQTLDLIGLNQYLIYLHPCRLLFFQDYNIEISWALTPAVAILQYTGNTFTRIPEGSLQPLSSYELSCSGKRRYVVSKIIVLISHGIKYISEAFDGFGYSETSIYLIV